MDPILFGAFAIAYAGLLAWGVFLAARFGWLTPANLPLLVIAGLIYDNTVLATGSLLGEGPVLEGLSTARFWLHGLLTPLLVVFAWHAIRRTGARWATGPIPAVVAVTFAIALVVLEFTTVVAGVTLTPEREYGALGYSATGTPAGPPLMVLFVAAALLIAGGVVWRRQRWPWLFLGSAVMTAGSAIPIPVESAAVTNLFELVLLGAVLATKQHQDRTRVADEGLRGSANSAGSIRYSGPGR